MSEKILLIDTATENCSAALYLDGKLSYREEEAPREHSQKLLPMVDALLEEAGVQLADLDAIAFGRGPGSFTGIRICTALTQGLALGADKPVIPVSNLAGLAQGAIESGSQDVIAAIDARMGEVYFGRFIANGDGVAELVGQELVISPESLLTQWDIGKGPIVAVGTGFETYPELTQADNIELVPQLRLPSAKMMMSLALFGWRHGHAISVDDVEPVYLRNEVAWKKLPGRE